MKKLILLTFATLLFSCGSKTSKTQEEEVVQVPVPTIKSEAFDKLPDGTQIDKYILENSKGVKLEVITYGGIITSLVVPDREGKLGDIVLGHDSMKGYLTPAPYFGAIIGRFGNRIANGKFELDGETYQLAQNDGKNHLHGGEKGFDKVVWTASEIHNDTSTGVLLKYTSPDMEEGYPGTMEVQVSYVLGPENTLEISYEAISDKKTVVNLTNHAYFNLGDDKSTILNHELKLYANKYLPVDSTLIPTGELRSVAGTPFDFTVAKRIGQEIDADNNQLMLGKGYDHCWVLDTEGDYLKLAAELYEPNSGRVVQISTTEPAIQFYSGNFLDGTLVGKKGRKYEYRSGLCLETQHYPDSPNQPDFPSVVLNPDEKYTSKTQLKFSAR